MPRHAHDRVIELLQSGYTGTVPQIADAVFKSRQVVGPIIKSLRDAGRLRIAGWVKHGRGEPTRIYGRADGTPDAPKPAPYGQPENCRRYRARLRDRLGPEIGAQVLRAMDKGVAVVVVEGRVLYRRGEGVLVDRIDREAA